MDKRYFKQIRIELLNDSDAKRVEENECAHDSCRDDMDTNGEDGDMSTRSLSPFTFCKADKNN